MSGLQTNMTQTLDSFSTLLAMLTNSFLLEEELHHLSHAKLQRAVDNHQSSFTSLKKNLTEARSEWFFGWPFVTRDHDRHEHGHTAADSGENTLIGTWRAYEDAVDSLNRLAQHLNGLRSGTRLQYELTKGGVVGSHTRDGGSGKSKVSGTQVPGTQVDGEEDDEHTALLKAAAAMFGDLVDDLGPPLKALSVRFSCFS